MAPRASAQSLSAISFTVRTTPIASPLAASASSISPSSSKVAAHASSASRTTLRRHALGPIGQQRVGEEVGPFHDGDELVEHAAVDRVAGDDDAAPVAEGEHRVVAGTEVGDGAAFGLAPGHVPVGTVVHAQHGLGHRHLDPLAPPGALALVQRRQHAGQALEGGVDVGVRRTSLE